MTTKNPFDFTDVSDLSEDAQKRLSTSNNAATAQHAEEYANLVKLAGRPVSISEVIGAAERHFGADNVPKADATIRNYLNTAVANKLLSKPTKFTYAASDLAEATPTVSTPATKIKEPAKPAKEATPAKEEAPATASAEEEDPLAGL